MLMKLLTPLRWDGRVTGLAEEEKVMDVSVRKKDEHEYENEVLEGFSTRNLFLFIFSFSLK